MTASFTCSPLLVAHCLGLRLIALGQARVDLRLAAAAFFLVLAGMLVGCVSPPDAGQRPVSQARTDLADTRLAAVAAASMPAAREQQSGLRLLPAGDQAFEARIALARAAQVASLLRGERQPRSFEVRSNGGGEGLQWIAQGGAEPVVFAQEPNLGWTTQLRLSVVSVFVNEELL
ncbi:MAG: hypothetical protein ABJA77_01480 [Variovorax sp.]